MKLSPRRIMSVAATAIAVTTLTATAAFAEPVTGADNVTTSGHVGLGGGHIAYLSVNWDDFKRNSSSTKYDDSGAIDYIVVSSDVQLKRTDMTWVAVRTSGYLNSGTTWVDKGIINGRYTYRVDPTAGNYTDVTVWPTCANQSTCSFSSLDLWAGDAS